MGLSKTQLIESVAKATGLKKKDVELCVKTVFEQMAEEITKGESVNIVGFGNFTVVTRQGRQGVNPRTKEKIMIPEKRAIKFKAGKSLAESVNVEE